MNHARSTDDAGSAGNLNGPRASFGTCAKIAFSLIVTCGSSSEIEKVSPSSSARLP